MQKKRAIVTQVIVFYGFGCEHKHNAWVRRELRLVFRIPLQGITFDLLDGIPVAIEMVP